MAVQRLTYLFLTFYENSRYQTNVGEQDSIMFTSEFPFTFDSDLALPRSVRNSDAVRDDNGNVISMSVEITDNARYNDRDWFIGLAINGQEIWDGIPRSATDLETGIELKFQNSVISVFASGFLPDGRGFISISKKLSSIGLLDNVEILIKNARTRTPWIYYGNIPERQSIAEEQFGRNPGGMGGVPDSLTPSQAMGYEYYVDFEQGSFFQSIIVPFVSSFFLPIVGGTGFTLSQNFFMGDILDGDGRIAVRSNVNFKINSISLNESLAFADVQIFNIINTGAFRTLNYSEIDYSSKTYSQKKIIKNTRFYLAFQDEKKFNNIYYNLGETIRVFLGANIDFDTCYFSVFLYSGKSGSLLVSDANDIGLFCDTLKSMASSTVEGGIPHQLASVDLLMKNKISADAKIDSDSGEFEETKYAQIFFGDLLFDAQQLPISESGVSFTSNGLTVQVPVNAIGAKILLSESEDISIGADKFSKPLLLMYGFKPSSIYGFQAIESFAAGSGIEMSDADLVEEYSFFNAPEIISQCKRVCSPILGTADNPISWQDNDGDNLITYIDRIYDLYSNFNPSVAQVEKTFFGDRGSEMRFWRKICPLGNLFSFHGRILSSERVRGNSFLLRVNIVMQNPNYQPGNGEEQFIDTELENNIIHVYYENGAKSNVANSSTDGVFEFKGRLFMPSYWLGDSGKGIQIANGINLNDPSELTAWYRILPETSIDLLESIVPNNEPVIIVRTNVAGGSDPTSADGNGPVSNVFLDASNTNSFFKISQFSERIEDNILKVFEDQEDLIVINSSGRSEIVFSADDSSSNISLQSIEFDMEIPSPSEEYGEFEFEIFYKESSSGPELSLRRFWSAVSFDNDIQSFNYENGIASNIKIQLDNSFVLYAQDSWRSTESNTGQLFDIAFPYQENSHSSDGIKHFFRWSKNDYTVKVYLNDKPLSTSVDDPSSGSQAIVDTVNSSVLLSTPISKKDYVYVQFTNRAGNTGLLKSANSVGIKMVSEPRSNPASLGPPVFRNFKINKSASTKSVERVDANYYNPSGISVNTDHFIAPALGFAVLGSRNWDLAIDDRNSTAGGANNVRITGKLVSPIWFFDAFTNDLSKKLVSEESARNLVAIDRVYSNMTSTFTQPYVEIISIGFDPPSPEIISRVTSIYDPLMQRYTIAYNVDKNIAMKYSHTGFRDRDGTYANFDQRNRSQRQEIAVYSGQEREEELGTSQTFGIQSQIKPDSVLIGLRLYGGITGKQSSVQNTGVMELMATIGGESVPFGYSQFNGDRTGLLVGFTDDNGVKKGFHHLPITSGIQELSLSEYEGAEFGAEIEKISGVFVDSLTEGQSPALFQTPYGTYIIFFSEQKSGIDTITGLISEQQTNRWIRPGTSISDPNAYKPVSMITGYVNPLVIQNPNSHMVNLFLYNKNQQSIDLLTIPYSAFERFSAGIDEDDGEYSTTTDPDNIKGFSDLIKDRNVSSWKKVFSEGRSLFPIVFSSTQDYSATIGPEGGIYLASISTSSELRLLYSSDSGVGEFSPNNWMSIGIDILDENGHLAKVTSAEDIYSICLNSNPIAGNLELFISTKTKRLILFRIPSSLISFSAKLQELDSERLEKLQEEVNDILPILVIGNNVETTEDIIADGSIKEDFENQLPSVQWFSNGELYIVYYKDLKIKGIKSTTGGSFWRNVEEI